MQVQVIISPYGNLLRQSGDRVYKYYFPPLPHHSPSLIPPSTRGYNYRTDEAIERTGGEKRKNNYPLVGVENCMFLINKSYCLRLVRGLEVQKLKLSCLYFIPKILCLLMGAFFILPSQPRGAQKVMEQEEVAGSRHQLGIFSLFCPWGE